MGFGVDLDRPRPAATERGPQLMYREVDGTLVPVDERAPATARERALARGLLLHALALVDAADRRP